MASRHIEFNTKDSPVLSPISSSSSSHASQNTQTALPSPGLGHRSSLADNVNSRTSPSSPRERRHLSMSGTALQDLLMHPYTRPDDADLRFQDRDWRTIKVHEIVDPAEARFVELSTSIEETTKLLIKSGAPNVVLIRQTVKTNTAIDTFDYSDLNTYLLLVLGLVEPDEAAKAIAVRARGGETLALKDVLNHLGKREQPTLLPHTADLTQAMEVLGGGLHRVIVCKEGTSEAVSVLSQLRLVRLFWENHQNFAATQHIYSRELKELDLGVKDVVAIQGDKPVSEALLTMHYEGVTSLPVLDNNRNVIGNISHVDVRLLTDTSSIPLLSATCIHFISVILSERGLEDGKDAYPVFYVSPFSTLAHTVAKLCATRSHRMWIVDEPSPANSVPPSPKVQSMQSSTGSLPTRTAAPATEVTLGPPYTSTNPSVAVSAAQLPGQSMSGRLLGVVSLTDVLNLFARASGLSPTDPAEVRQRRRRSSSSSVRPRMSMEGVRPTTGETIRASVELVRSASTASRR